MVDRITEGLFLILVHYVSPILILAPHGFKTILTIETVLPGCTWGDRTMSGQAAFRTILILSARELVAAWAQHEPQYWGMCWKRAAINPSLAFHVPCSFKSEWVSAIQTLKVTQAWAFDGLTFSCWNLTLLCWHWRIGGSSWAEAEALK